MKIICALLFLVALVVPSFVLAEKYDDKPDFVPAYEPIEVKVGDRAVNYGEYSRGERPQIVNPDGVDGFPFWSKCFLTEGSIIEVVKITPAYQDKALVTVVSKNPQSTLNCPVGAMFFISHKYEYYNSMFKKYKDYEMEKAIVEDFLRENQ